MNSETSREGMPGETIESPIQTPKNRVLVARPDGRGALMTGGTNKGGTGAPSHALIRECALEMKRKGKHESDAVEIQGRIARCEPAFPGGPTPNYNQATAAFARLSSILPVIQIQYSANVGVPELLNNLGPILLQYGLPRESIAAIIRELGESVKQATDIDL